MKATISRSERLQLVGLLALAQQHNAFLNKIYIAACDLLVVDHDDGHVSDAVFGTAPDDIDADRLLTRIGITVSDQVRS